MGEAIRVFEIFVEEHHPECHSEHILVFLLAVGGRYEGPGGDEDSRADPDVNVLKKENFIGFSLNIRI